jgi:hypothetical protein
MGQYLLSRRLLLPTSYEASELSERGLKVPITTLRAMCARPYPEVINGRLAMLGFGLGVWSEMSGHETLFSQFAAGYGVQVALVAAVGPGRYCSQWPGRKLGASSHMRKRLSFSLSQGPRRKLGASTCTRKRLSLSHGGQG